mmetsp:Transcript_13301/g.44072  ORF Transcript_13301/g.44072 Transcript_13301/m.44072 type:complete len:250 (+) Transcript_13301:4596-5345(+)
MLLSLFHAIALHLNTLSCSAASLVHCTFTTTGVWFKTRIVFSTVLPTETCPKSSSLSESRMNGYLPTARTSIAKGQVTPPSWKSCAGVTRHAADATDTVASVGVNSHVTVAVCPGASAPLFGSKWNGKSSRHSYVRSTSPSFVKLRVFDITWFTAPYPRSQIGGNCNDKTGSGHTTATRNEPHPATLNSTKSSYCSRLIGRNVTSTDTLIPGESLITSGNSISKYRVAGSLYFTLTALVDVFFSTTDRT